MSRARNGAAQVKNGNATLRSNWRNHVFADNARPTGNVTGIAGVIIGGTVTVAISSMVPGSSSTSVFYPWDAFLYPYGNYYGYGYYPYLYNYDPGYYDSYGDQAEEYYGQNSHVDQYTDSIRRHRSRTARPRRLLSWRNRRHTWTADTTSDCALPKRSGSPRDRNSNFRHRQALGLQRGSLCYPGINL